MVFALLLLAGCPAEAPPACAAMCDAAAELYGGCLEAWGSEWTAAGYEDEADFRESCATWGWEMAQLEPEDGDLAAVCAERRDAMAAEDAACEDFTGIDWHTPPW